MTCTCWDKAGVTCEQCRRDDFWEGVSAGETQLPIVNRGWERDEDE